jgi:hypothetical protein
MKYLRYKEQYVTHYFWRTTQQQEIDLIEDHSGALTAFEFKWSKNAKARIPLTFTENYPGSKTAIISPENIENITTSIY